MAFRTQKISQMTPKGSDLEATDLIEVSTIESGSYVTRSITGQELIDAIPAPTGFVPTSRTLTINGTTQDLSADRTFTISTGITIGTTAIASGTVGRVLFQGTGNVVQQSSSLAWDATNEIFNVVGRINAKSTTAQPSSLIVEGTTGVNSGNAGFVVRTGTGYQATFFAADSLAGQGIAGLGIFSGSATPFGLQTGAPNGAFFIHNNGNIGIGTSYTNAGYRLDVNGTARVQSNGTFGITNTRILTIRPEDTTGAYGNSCSIRGGVSNGRLDFYSATNITELRDNIILLTSATGPSVQVGTGSINLNVGGTRLQVAPTTGNVLINTTTDAGFKLDVNGTARVQGALTLSAASPSITLGGDLTITSTAYPSRVASYDTLNSNLNLLAGGFGEGMFIGSRLTGSRTSTTFVSPDGLNAVGSAKITAYDGNGNTNIQASNNGNRSIVLRGLGASGAVLIGNITTGNGTNYSAILQADSTTQGFLPPRMTTTQKNAIASPVAGLQIYDTTLNRPCFYDGTTWITL